MMTPATLQKNKSLAPHTTFHVGGVADYVVEVFDAEEMWAALSWAKAHTTTPPLILGGGSNVLISDEGYRGLVIINRISGIVYEEQGEEVFVKAGSGVILDELVTELVAHDYWGLENLSGIPGTVGATPIQNVGAYGVEVKDVITTVEALHRETGERRTFTNLDCNFSYRDSFFKTVAPREWVITAVMFKVTKDYSPVLSYKDLEPLAEMESLTPGVVRNTVLTIRSEKFPDWRTVGTGGSFFKNPIISTEHFKTLQSQYEALPGYPHGEATVKVSLGFILDKVCNLKGYRVGKVRLYEAQALVLVAERGATATEIDSFATQIEERVFSKTNIRIDREVQYV